MTGVCPTRTVKQYTVHSRPSCSDCDKKKVRKDDDKGPGKDDKRKKITGKDNGGAQEQQKKMTSDPRSAGHKRVGGAR